jgi:hypothetical protein
MGRLVVLGILVMAVGSVLFGAELPRKVKPVVVWTGTDSKQAKDSFSRCCSPADWLAIWKAHSGREGNAERVGYPEVDFDSYMVIAVFQKTSRLRLVEVVEEKECVRVRSQPWGNQIAFIPTNVNGFEVKVFDLGRGLIDLEKPYPLSFAFVVLPKGNKAVILEEDVQDLIGKSPVWKERARFPALPEK